MLVLRRTEMWNATAELGRRVSDLYQSIDDTIVQGLNASTSGVLSTHARCVSRYR
jgi:hypothetical protein